VGKEEGQCSLLCRSSSGLHDKRVVASRAVPPPLPQRLQALTPPQIPPHSPSASPSTVACTHVPTCTACLLPCPCPLPLPLPLPLLGKRRLYMS